MARSSNTTAQFDKHTLWQKFILFAIAIVFVLCYANTTRAAGPGPVTVNGTILSKSICKFNTASAALPFGILDPANPVNVNASTTIDFRCMGAAGTAVFLITHNGGMNPLGPDNQMEHVGIPGQFLRYTLTLTPDTGSVPKNVWQTLTIDGTVLGADYQVVPPGDYQDTVVITITP
jgi:spore coat protein U-like protein